MNKPDLKFRKQYGRKKYEYYAKMTYERNHKLINVSNSKTPSQGKLTVFCKNCEQEFTTSAKSYENARVTGCPNCKAIKARNQQNSGRIESSTTDKQFTKEKQLKKETKRRKILEKRKAFVHIYNRKTLEQYLQNEKNEYSVFILEKLEKPTPPTLKGFELQKHHIIPKHAGGPNAKWNLINLTKEEHTQAHVLRYKAYGEFGDYNYLSTTNAIGNLAEQNPGFENLLKQQKQKGSYEQRKKGIGIFEQDAARRGGQASKEVMASLTDEERKTLDKRHQAQMSTKVQEVLYKGAEFVHNRTGTVVLLYPEQALTLTQLKYILAAALPTGDSDREKLIKTSSPANVTSAISKMIRGIKDRPSAYGWKLKNNK